MILGRKEQVMKVQSTQETIISDEAAIRSIPYQLIKGWNEGSGNGFAAPFTDDADFVAFEGTHLKGRREITSFHQQIFDTIVKGSRLEGEIKFVRFLSPELAYMHSVVRVTMPGESNPYPGRDSMQLFVVAKHNGEWRVEALQNSRILTTERQSLSDHLDALPVETQHKVVDFVASLKQSQM
jgi:uncharacterized protein (TIGR02246 family)